MARVFYLHLYSGSLVLSRSKKFRTWDVGSSSEAHFSWRSVAICLMGLRLGRYTHRQTKHSATSTLIWDDDTKFIVQYLNTQQNANCCNVVHKICTVHTSFFACVCSIIYSSWWLNSQINSSLQTNNKCPEWQGSKVLKIKIAIPKRLSM